MKVLAFLLLLLPATLHAANGVTFGGADLTGVCTLPSCADVEWDAIVRLGDATNVCNAFATAIEPWIDGDGSTVHSVLVTGRGTVTDDQFYDAGDFRRCFYVGSTSTFDGSTDHAVGDADSGPWGRLYLHFNNAQVITTMTGMTEPSFVLMTGNGYGRGFSTMWDAGDATSQLLGALHDGVHVTGRLEWYNAVVEEQGGWVTGETPSFPLSTDGFTTTTVGWMISMASAANFTDFHFVADGAAIDGDDIGVVAIYNNLIQMGTISISRIGTGVALYGSQNGNFASGGITGNDVGITFGDVDNGADVSVAPNCTKGGKYCLGTGGSGNTRTAAVMAWQPRANLMIEGNEETNGRIVDGDLIDLRNVNTEFYSTMTSHGWIIGAGVDSSDADEPCCNDAEATNNCSQVSGASVSRVLWGGGTKSISDRYNTSFKAICFGPSFTYGVDGVNHLGYIDMTDVAWHNVDTCAAATCTDNALFEFDSDADAKVLLDSQKWRYVDTQEVPAYKHIRFEDASSFTAGINASSPTVDGSTCLRRSFDSCF